MLGKVLKNILIFLLGMIFGVVALFGGGYLLVNNTKLGQISDAVDKEGQYIGEELKEYTIIEAINLFSDQSKTIGDYQRLLPILKTVIQENLNKDEVKQFVTIDFDKLDALTLSNIGTDISSAITVTLSFNALKGLLGFELPDLPLFTSAKTFVQVTDEEFVISPFYNDATKYSDIYYLSGENYINAYEGDQLKLEAENQALYYQATGISDIPVTDALNALSSTLNMDEMTFAQLKNTFGIDILGSGDTLMAKLINENDTLNGVANTIEQNVDALSLSELGIDFSSGIMSKIISSDNKIGELRGSTGYTPINFEEKINALSVGDLGMNLSGIAGKVLYSSDTIGSLTDGTTNFNDRINGLELGTNGLGLTFSGLLADILEPTDTIGGLTDGSIDIEDRIDGIRLGDLGMNIPTTGAVANILNENMTVGQLKSKDFNSEINSLTVAELGITLDGVAGQIVKNTDKIGELSGASGYTAISFNDRLNGLTLSALGLTLDGIASKILSPSDTIGDLTNGNIKLDEKINSLTLGNDLGITFSGLLADILEPTDTIGGLTDGSIDINAKINALTLEKIGLNLTGIAGKILKPEYTIGSLTDGTVDINAEVNKLTIADLGLDLGTLGSKIIKPEYTLGALSGADGYTKINLANEIDNLTLGDFVDVQSSSNTLIKNLSATKIGELENKLTTLTVIDVYGEQTTGVFAELQYQHNQDGTLKEVDGKKVPTLINNIGDEIKYVKLTSMVSSDDMNHNSILEYLNKKGTTLNSLASDMETIKLQDVFEYEVFKKITATGTEKHSMKFDSTRRVFTLSTNENGLAVYTEVDAYSSTDGVEYYHVCPEASAWLKIMYNRTGEPHQRIYTELEVYLLASETNKNNSIVVRIDNISDSFKEASMQELYEIGFIDTKPNEFIMYKTLGEILNGGITQ